MTRNLFIIVAAIWLQFCSAQRGTVHMAKGNGILWCRPGVNFPRDCGNRCQCNDDGSGANCSSLPCSEIHAEFDEANDLVYKELDQLQGNGTEPVFKCEPFTEREVNDVNGSCYCARSGTNEICTTRIGDPWGIKI